MAGVTAEYSITVLSFLFDLKTQPVGWSGKGLTNCILET